MKTLEEINEEYIPKQKIKDRIKELHNMGHSSAEPINCKYCYCIKELQQILGDEAPGSRLKKILSEKKCYGCNNTIDKCKCDDTGGDE